MKIEKLVIIALIFLSSLSCVQETHLKTIHVKVDMSSVESIKEPGIKGQFTSPSWQETLLLTDENNDGIYEAKIEVQAAQFGIEFKFVNNNEYELQGQDNRFVKFEYKPETFIYEATFNNQVAKITKK